MTPPNPSDSHHALKNELTPISVEIARQVVHMAPDDITPENLGMMAFPPKPDQLIVMLTEGERNPEGMTSFKIELTLMDTYEVIIHDYDVDSNGDLVGPPKEQTLGNVFNVDLGQIIFGSKAKPWTDPLYKITDGDGNIIAEG